MPKNITDKFNYAIKDTKNVYIVATADKLYNDIIDKRGATKLIFCTNGVDYEFLKHFDKYKISSSRADNIRPYGFAITVFLRFLQHA